FRIFRRAGLNHLGWRFTSFKLNYINAKDWRRRPRRLASTHYMGNRGRLFAAFIALCLGVATPAQLSSRHWHSRRKRNSAHAAAKSVAKKPAKKTAATAQEPVDPNAPPELAVVQGS